MASVTSTSGALRRAGPARWLWRRRHALLSFVAAFAHPQEAAEQGFGRTDDFTYGMIYVTYSY